MTRPAPSAAFVLALATALLAVRYAHDVLRLALIGEHLDLGAYVLYTRGAWAGVDTFAPGALAEMARGFPSTYASSPPTFMPGGYLVMLPLAWLPYRLAALAWVAIGQAGVLTACLVWGRLVGLRGMGAAAAAVVTLAFHPILENVATGQLSLLILALIALGVAAQLAGRSLLAAVALSVAFQLKPHYVLLVVFVAWIGRPALALLTLGLVALWSGVAVLTFGFAWLAAYWTGVRGLARSAHLHLWVRNLSPHAVLHRLVGGDGDTAVLEAAAVLLALAIGAIVLWTTRPPYGRVPGAAPAAWSMAIAALPLAAPLTEEHHLALLLLPVLFAIAHAGDLEPWWRGALVVAIVLLASGYSFDGFGRFDRGLASLVHGGKAAGAALLLAVVGRLAWRARAVSLAEEALARA